MSSAKRRIDCSRSGAVKAGAIQQQRAAIPRLS
jgi:hypothetical protein